MSGRPPSSPLFPSPPLSRPPRPTAAPIPARRAARRDVMPGVRRGRRRLDRDGRCSAHALAGRRDGRHTSGLADRKSTRLNSSHLVISYAVFCLKKKKKPKVPLPPQLQCPIRPHTDEQRMFAVHLSWRVPSAAHPLPPCTVHPLTSLFPCFAFPT